MQVRAGTIRREKPETNQPEQVCRKGKPVVLFSQRLNQHRCRERCKDHHHGRQCEQKPRVRDMLGAFSQSDDVQKSSEK
jgi:hypothetical protein